MKEDKQLLLKDLCARLPYGVICKLSAKDANVSINEKLDTGGLEHFIFGTMDVLPYLRRMSSMTEGEKEYIKNRWCYNDWDIDGPSSLWREKIDVEDADGIIDYFNEHHLDYRGLIPMGLALEAPADMYKIE